MPKEIEIKFSIESLPALTRALKLVGFKQLTRSTHEMNSLYDLPGQKLRKRDEMLRLRKYGKTWTLTHKAKSKAGRHKVRVELETEVENGPQMDTILRALGFDPCVDDEGHAGSKCRHPKGGTGVSRLLYRAWRDIAKRIRRLCRLCPVATVRAGIS